MESIPFYKMSGSGNDFIVIDNREGRVAADNLFRLITKSCERKMSVGADGFILIEDSEQVDFKWQFYNADGSRAEMCGNGARCAARFAHLNGIASERMSFETDAGIISAEVSGARAKVKMSDPFDFKPDFALELSIGTVTATSINTGVPHVVLPAEAVAASSLEAVAVFELGREIRNHEMFAPVGTNANFISPEGRDAIAIRTYERGVEGETLACGTGSVAGAIVASLGGAIKSPVTVRTRSGGVLTIHFESVADGFRNVYMEGDARIIYKAEMTPDAWDW